MRVKQERTKITLYDMLTTIIFPSNEGFNRPAAAMRNLAQCPNLEIGEDCCAVCKGTDRDSAAKARQLRCLQLFTTGGVGPSDHWPVTLYQQ